MTFGKRVKDRLDELGMSYEEAGRKVGASAGAIFKIVNGKTKNPRFIVELADILGLSVSWLKTGVDREGVGMRHKNSEIQLKIEKSFIPPQNMQDVIPLYGPASASSNENIRLTEEFIVGYEIRPPALQNVKDGFMMLVSGDSMEPRMSHGEKLWVHPRQVPAPKDDCVVVFKTEGNAIVKRYMGETETEIKLAQWNPQKNITVKKTEISKIYAVLGIQRR